MSHERRFRVFRSSPGEASLWWGSTGDVQFSWLERTSACRRTWYVQEDCSTSRGCAAGMTLRRIFNRSSRRLFSIEVVCLQGTSPGGCLRLEEYECRRGVLFQEAQFNRLAFSLVSRPSACSGSHHGTGESDFWSRGWLWAYALRSGCEWSALYLLCVRPSACRRFCRWEVMKGMGTGWRAQWKSISYWLAHILCSIEDFCLQEPSWYMRERFCRSGVGCEHTFFGMCMSNRFFHLLTKRRSACRRFPRGEGICGAGGSCTGCYREEELIPIGSYTL